jgi:outer membrane protein assembly factor BamE
MNTTSSSFIKSGPTKQPGESIDNATAVKFYAPPEGELRTGARRADRAAFGAALLAGTLMVAGCGSVTNYLPRFLTPYRPDVQQGNVVTSDMVEQLRPGMTRDQVKFMLGTALLTDGFHPDRWDYLYYLNPRSGAPQRRNLVIYFKDNRLDHFTSDPMPAESMADNLILGRKAPVQPSTPAREAAPQPSAPAKEPDAQPGAPAKGPNAHPSASPDEPTPQATPPASSQ